MKAKVTLFVNNITTQQLISGTKVYYDITYKQNPPQTCLSQYLQTV